MEIALILVGWGLALVGNVVGWRAAREGVSAPRRPVLAVGLLCFGMGMVFATVLLTPE